MANKNSAGFGFTSAGTLGNTPATNGLSEYFIDAGDSANKFNGGCVQVTAGYIVTAEDSDTAESVGVLQGIFYNAATTLKPTFASWYDATITPANSEDTTAFVLDNPMQLYEASVNALMGADQPAAVVATIGKTMGCLLYTSPSPRD